MRRLLKLFSGVIFSGVLFLAYNNMGFLDELTKGKVKAALSKIKPSSTNNDEEFSANQNSEQQPKPKPKIIDYNGKKWVFINEKAYEYNPDNVYNVNGVSTFYNPYQDGEKKPALSGPAKAEIKIPKNLDEVMKTINQANKNIKQHEAQLEEITK